MGSEIGLIRVLSANTARSLVWPVAGAVADRVRGASAGAPGHSRTAVRKLSYVIPQQRAFWEGVVRFTPRLGKGVNYKIGLVGPKVRFKFRKGPGPRPKTGWTRSTDGWDQVHRQRYRGQDYTKKYSNILGNYGNYLYICIEIGRT